MESLEYHTLLLNWVKCLAESNGCEIDWDKTEYFPISGWSINLKGTKLEVNNYEFINKLNNIFKRMSVERCLR